MRHAIVVALVAGALCVPASASAAGWTAAVPQPHPGSLAVGDLAVHPGGRAWIASSHFTGTETEVRISERRPGEGFGAPQVVGTNEGHGVDLVELAGEAPLLVWPGHVAQRRDDGSWVAADGFGTFRMPEIVPLGGGALLALWLEGTELRARVRPAGGEFGAAQVLLDGLSTGGESLDGAAMSDGNVVVAWSRTENDTDPDTGDERVTGTLRLAFGLPGTEWADPVVVDAVSEAAPGPDDEDLYVDASFPRIELEAKPSGGWLLAAEARTERSQLGPGPDGGSGELTAWDGAGTEVQASELLDESGRPELTRLIVEPSGGALLGWGGGASYRAAGQARFPTPKGFATYLARIGADRWYALNYSGEDSKGAGLTLSAFSTPLGPVRFDGDFAGAAQAFAGDGAGHALLATRGGVGARLRLYDEVAPALDGLSVPAGADRGAAVPLSVRASDPWTAVDVVWDFGDGSTATGAAHEHAYARPGRYEVKVTATDAAGNQATETRAIEVTTPPPVVVAPGPPGPPVVVAEPPVLDRLAPVVRRLRVTAARRRPAVRLGLSEAGRLDVRLHRLVRGVRREGSCRTLRAQRRKGGRACTRAVAAGRFDLAVAAGEVRRTLRGRLAPGRYRATVRVRDAAGNRSAPVRATFRVPGRKVG